jgi:hypothetical protein
MIKVLLRALIFGIPLTVPFLLLGGFFFYQGLIASNTALTDDGYSLKTFWFLMGAGFTVIPVLIVIGTLIFVVRKRNQIKEIVTYGKPGTAKVLKLSDTGVRINDDPRIKLLLEISIPDYPTYQAEKTLTLSIVYLPRVQVGSTVSVLADPTQPGDEKRIGLVLE